MQKVIELWKSIKSGIPNVWGAEQDQQTKMLWMALILSLALTAWLVSVGQSPNQSVSKFQEESFSLDTFIPADHTVVPIQVADYESLDQVFGNFGVVDLYTAPSFPNEKARLVAEKVKLLRSGKSRSHFGVLVPAREALPIKSHLGEFTVSVRNPKSLGTEFVKAKPKQEVRLIIYDSEE